MAALRPVPKNSRCRISTRRRKFEDETRTMEKQVVSDISSRLPPEMLERVFSHLDPDDLLTVMLVCKGWNKVAEACPALWSWVEITPQPRLNLINLKRLQGAREIDISNDYFFPKGSWRKLLRAILKHPGLKKINLWIEFENLEAAESELLTQVFAKMEEIEIYNGELAKYVAEAVLQRPNNLKRLLLENTCPDGSLDPVLFTMLNKFEVLEVGLNEEQANLLLKMMREESSVKSLTLLGHQEFSKLEPTSFFAAFDKLKGLQLVNNWERDNVPKTTLCEAVAAGKNLRKLNLPSHLFQVDDHLVGRMAIQMATQLEHLHIDGNERQPMKDQIGIIVEAIANTEAGTLKKLGLNKIDFSLVDCGVLARMATQVGELDLDSRLLSNQVKAIFEAIAAGPGKLKELTIARGLDTVDADVLAIAVNKLKVFWHGMPWHWGIHLSSHHIEKILSRALERTSLRDLWIKGEKRKLDPNLISKAKEIIPSVSIHSDDCNCHSDSDWTDSSDSELGSDSESDSESESD